MEFVSGTMRPSGFVANADGGRKQEKPTQQLKPSTRPEHVYTMPVLDYAEMSRTNNGAGRPVGNCGCGGQPVVDSGLREGEDGEELYVMPSLNFAEMSRQNDSR